jgi:hypothetical protein
MRLPRMTLRRWMGAVAVAALLLVTGRLVQRRAFYLGQLTVNRSMEAIYRIDRNGRMDYGALKHPYLIANPELFNDDETLKSEYVKIVEEQHAYFDGLVRKYSYAAAHPWVSVEPDAPRP